jgi:tetratricopeptide (TPR) repeat protein
VLRTRSPSHPGKIKKVPNAQRIEHLLASASAAHSAGRLADAELAAKEVAREEPGNEQATLLLAVIAAKTGRDLEAKEGFLDLHRRVPHSFEAAFWLSILYRRNGDLPEAIRYAQLGVQLRAGDAYSQNNLGLCLMDALRLEEAVTAFQRASESRPDFAPIFHNLGTALFRLGRDRDAAKAFDQAIMLAPRSLDSLLSLGQVLISMTNPGEAVKVAQRALSLDPKSATAHLLMASALVEDSRAREAEPYLKQAVELNPTDSRAQALLGLRLQSLGNFQEANHHLSNSLAAEPNQGFAYFALVHNNKIKDLEPGLVENMEALAERGSLPPREQTFLEYGLGRAFENLGRYEEAITHFDAANALSRKLKFGDQEFYREEYAKTFYWLIETYTDEFIRSREVKGNTSALPIVIVGMMRSGTTLVEQILSSHPKVGGAGEQRFWPNHRPELLREGADFHGLGRQYVDRLQHVAPGFERVVDKMPSNYELCGPIHISLPKAKIIHMRRHPVDTCISIYTTPNRVPISFAYNRANIVFAYRQYRRLMAHWRSVLSPDAFLEVDYEAVVSDREGQVRRIAEFLELEWSDALLHHESTERNVLTPSLWQVRQPIYTSSIQRWKRYEPWLREFAELLPEA